MSIPTDNSALSLLVVTYNVNRYWIGDSWLSFGSLVPDQANPPDLIAVSLQEAAPNTSPHVHRNCSADPHNVHDSNLAHNARRRSSSSSSSSSSSPLPYLPPDLSALPAPAFRGLLTDPITAHWWLDKLLSDLGCAFTRRAYCPLTSPPLVLGGTLLAVLVAADVRHRISDVRSALTAVGPFGFPNKGAVALSLLWDNHVRVALVGAHLPHGKRPGPRDRALHQVVQGLVFEPADGSASPPPLHAPVPSPPASTFNATLAAANARVAPATPSPPRLRSRGRSQDPLVSTSSSTPDGQDDDQDDADTAPLLSEPSCQNNDEARSAPLTLGDHHVTVLAGDLNYRTSLPSFASAAPLLGARNWPALLAHDQLACSPQVQAHAWQEPAVHFGPTYRTIPVGRPLPGVGLPRSALVGPADTLLSDRAGSTPPWVGLSPTTPDPPAAPPTHAAWPVSYDPRRVPGWTDRVLFRTGSVSPVRVVAQCYAAFPRMRQSDHVPVAAVLRLEPAEAQAAGQRQLHLDGARRGSSGGGGGGVWPAARRHVRECLWPHRAANEWTLWLVYVLASRTRTVLVVGGLVLGAVVAVWVLVWVVRLMGTFGQ